MIPAKGSQAHPEPWKEELRRAFTHVDDLLRFLEIDPDCAGDLTLAARDFAVRVPRGFAELMRKGDRGDPLLLQVLPSAQEVSPLAEGDEDPVGDAAAAQGAGVLKKYRGRALLLATSACAVNCRYCFRRHFPYRQLSLRHDIIDEMVATLRRDPNLREVILSGGDPLMLDDDQLEEILSRLREVTQLRRLRLHTRLPVVLPERVTPRLGRLLRHTSLLSIIVVQVNHPNELGSAAREALRALREQGSTLLNQSVLLRGVNDDPEILTALSESLIHAHVIPYYLHQLDPVRGGTHFAVSDRRAREIANRLRADLPGYLIPRLVREIPGAASKQPLC